MAPVGGGDGADDFNGFLDLPPKDFDPEPDYPLDGSSASNRDSGEEAGRDEARDHYVEVEQSKLRRPKTVALGPQYRGLRISRNEVKEIEHRDDPFSRDFSDGESEGVDGTDGELRSSAGGEEDTTDDETGESELSDNVDPAPTAQLDADRRALAQDREGQQRLAASISQAHREEIEKGHAVRKQRIAFDSLLGARMKLQKAMMSVNTVTGMHVDEVGKQGPEIDEAWQGAEAAAFELWSSVNELREGLYVAKTGDKRKRTKFAVSTPILDLWEHLQSQEEDMLHARNAVLQKWSVKSRDAAHMPSRERLNNTVRQATIVEVLQEHLSHSERLMARAHTPRSCAPLQLAKKVIQDDQIYDDADFYGLLLKELLEQKSFDSVTASGVDVNLGKMRREAKTKKNVDTKASKGRKLRYTVHEKLQNFMAPEDRTTWSERQTDELFGSLFGQRMALREGEHDDEKIEDVVDPAVASAMLFRS